VCFNFPDGISRRRASFFKINQPIVSEISTNARKEHLFLDIELMQSKSVKRLSVRVAKKQPAFSTFAEDVLSGLSAMPKTLPPRYLYDDAGSQLFEEICELSEYYPTGCEREILQQNINEIARIFNSNACIVELGSGSSVKTELILKTFMQQNGSLEYVPIDISKSILVDSSKKLLRKHRKLHITALAADYHTALDHLRKHWTGRKLILFLGSSIGNFAAEEQIAFLAGIRADMTAGDRLLIGMDLKKDRCVLESAYDDSQGITAKFNINLLNRINRELGGDFNVSAFRHKAFFNESKSRIEMHLQSLEKQTVTIDTLKSEFHFDVDETIHTENSYKFTRQQITDLAFDTGFKVEKFWLDNRKWFSLNLFCPL
jgi:dimethylhistidine N-methyltransferase